MAKDRRCNLFDDNGRGRRLKNGSVGCFRDASACHFAHPHEREWETASPSYPPKHDGVMDSDSNFYYILAPSGGHDRGRDRDKERDKERDRKSHSSPQFDSSHRRHSASTRASPGSSRKSTLDTSLDATKRVKSPSASVCSDQLEMLRKDSKYRTKDPPSLRQDHAASVPHRSRSHSRDKQERVDMPSQKPPVPSRFSDKVTPTVPSMVPPEPPKPPPMPPPPPPLLPPLPNLPSFVSNQQPTGSTGHAPKGLKELSVEEQKSAWHERIDLMFTSITSRRDYTKLESNLNYFRSLSNSPHINNMSDVDRANVNAQKMTLELQMDLKRKEINDNIQKLIGSVFWPVLKTPGISEMEKALGETKKHVLEVRSLLDDVKNSSAALLKTSAADQTQDSERPSKRRKVEASGQSEDVIEDTAKELDGFRDKLTQLDRHLIDLENDITQRDRIISDEIELHIDARLEAEDGLYPPVKEPGEITPTEIEAVVDARNREIVHAVTVTGEEIGVLAQEIAELITKVNALEARCQALEAENREFKNKLLQNTLDHVKSQDELIRRDKEIQAITAALQAYISQASANQPISDLPTADYIIDALDSRLDGLLREKFSPTLVNMKKDVFDKVQESQNRTIETIGPKVVLLLKMVNLITARLGRPEEEAAHTG